MHAKNVEARAQHNISCCNTQSQLIELLLLLLPPPPPLLSRSSTPRVRTRACTVSVHMAGDAADGRNLEAARRE